jgi:hypothetical protein
MVWYVCCVSLIKVSEKVEADSGGSNSMEQSPWEANSHTAGQVIPCLLQNQSVHKSPPLDPILSHLNPVKTLSSCFFNIYLNNIPW